MSGARAAGSDAMEAGDVGATGSGAGPGAAGASGTAGLRTALEIDPDHPAFAGHFPGFPVLPGAVLLDEALHAIACGRGLDLLQWRITSAKFLRLVRPGEALILEHSAIGDGGIRFTIRAAAHTVASGILSHGG